MSKTKSSLLLLLVAFLWGGGFIATELAFSSFSPFEIVFFRFLIAAIGLYVLKFKTINKHFKENLKPGIIVGIILYLSFILQILGQSYSTPSVCAFLTSTNVIFVPIYAFLITRKKIDKYTMISLPIIIIGITLLTINSSLEINPGDILSLLCAMGFALSIFLAGYYGKKSHVETNSFSFIQFATAAILGALSFIFVPFEPDFSNSDVVLSLFYLGLVSTLACFYLQNIGLKHADETIGSLVLCTEAVFATILSAIFFKEVLEPKQILGIILIFISIVICETKLSFLKKN